MWTRRQTALLIRPIVFCQEERERGGERERRERRGERRRGLVRLPWRHTWLSLPCRFDPCIVGAAMRDTQVF